MTATAAYRRWAATWRWSGKSFAGPGAVSDARIDELHGHGYTDSRSPKWLVWWRCST